MAATGIIKWINEAKGFGLITPDSGGKDVFARFTPIPANGSDNMTVSGWMRLSNCAASVM